MGETHGVEGVIERWTLRQTVSVETRGGLLPLARPAQWDLDSA